LVLIILKNSVLSRLAHFPPSVIPFRSRRERRDFHRICETNGTIYPDIFSHFVVARRMIFLSHLSNRYVTSAISIRRRGQCSSDMLYPFNKARAYTYYDRP